MFVSVADTVLCLGWLVFKFRGCCNNGAGLKMVKYENEEECCLKYTCNGILRQ